MIKFYQLKKSPIKATLILENVNFHRNTIHNASRQ